VTSHPGRLVWVGRHRRHPRIRQDRLILGPSRTVFPRRRAGQGTTGRHRPTRPDRQRAGCLARWWPAVVVGVLLVSCTSSSRDVGSSGAWFPAALTESDTSRPVSPRQLNAEILMARISHPDRFHPFQLVQPPPRAAR